MVDIVVENVGFVEVVDCVAEARPGPGLQQERRAQAPVVELGRPELAQARPMQVQAEDIAGRVRGPAVDAGLEHGSPGGQQLQNWRQR